MDGTAPRWVRIGLVALAPGQLFTGLWAVLATRSWFDDFPGIGPDLVAAEPPFNAHLASDVGAGFLATGVALLAAAAWAHRSSVYVALLAYVSFTLPHVVHHAATAAPDGSGAAQAANVVILGSGLAFALLLAWGAKPPPGVQVDRRSPELAVGKM